jgi:hypothetical protein
MPVGDRYDTEAGTVNMPLSARLRASVPVTLAGLNIAWTCGGESSSPERRFRIIAQSRSAWSGYV